MPFEAFLSYAHIDNDDGWVDGFREGVCSIYHKLTGIPLALFYDSESISTAKIWERRIGTALSDSDVMIAILSPSYVRSSWCVREWEAFEAKERDSRARGIIGSDDGLIFPIHLYPFDRGRFDGAEADFVQRVRARQWLDVSSRLAGSPLRMNQLRAFAEEVIDLLAALHVRRRQNAAPPKSQQTRVTATIKDAANGLEWAASLSAKELAIEDARAFILALSRGEVSPWRLPTRKELATLVDKNALSIDPHWSPYPLREPFNAQRFGYLWSGEVVAGCEEDHVFIMNVRNGHIFNGKGYKGYVRAVRALGG